MENGGSNINRGEWDPNMNRELWNPNPPKSYAVSGKIMLTAIIILFAVVIFMVALHVYARWYLLRLRRRYLRRRRQRSSNPQIVFYVDSNLATSTQPPRGLDAPLLNSLPVFSYSSLTQTHALECAVCLSEFEENEMGRELPKCHHSFHIDCIDMWFHSHSTCPVCRSPVEPESNIPPQTHQTDSGECEPGTSSGLAERRKGLDVRIEVPRRSEFEGELRLSSPASQDFRSPGSRLLSLRRILSMNRRTTVVSPSGGTASSRGYVGAESDVELGQRESTRGPTRAQTPR